MNSELTPLATCYAGVGSRSAKGAGRSICDLKEVGMGRSSSTTTAAVASVWEQSFAQSAHAHTEVFNLEKLQQPFKVHAGIIC